VQSGSPDTDDGDDSSSSSCGGENSASGTDGVGSDIDPCVNLPSPLENPSGEQDPAGSDVAESAAGDDENDGGRLSPEEAAGAGDGGEGEGEGGSSSDDSGDDHHEELAPPN